MFSTNVLPTSWPSGTDSPNASVPLPSSPILQLSNSSFDDAVTSFPQRNEPIQYEASRNGPYVQHSVMEEEDDERDGNPTSPGSAPNIDKTRPNRQREPKVSTGKQFVFKLYELLENETATNFISWSKSGDALFIPDIKAFEANVMLKHFKEMKQWGSFQRQLHNYCFEKRDRGAGKALYAHSENKFRKGRPDLLPQVLRRQNCRMKALIGRDSGSAGERAPSPVAPTTPQSANHINPLVNENQLERENKQLKPEILEFYKREFERSGARLSALEDQGKAAADRHKATEDRLKAAEDRLKATEGQGNAVVDRLKAAEDRHKATEDRLKAADDRLKALEDQLKAAKDQLKALEDLLKAVKDGLLLLQCLSAEPSGNLEPMSMGDDRLGVPRVPGFLIHAHPGLGGHSVWNPTSYRPRHHLSTPVARVPIADYAQVATHTSPKRYQLQPIRSKATTNSPQLAFRERYPGNQGSEAIQPLGILSWALIHYLRGKHPVVIVSEHPLTTFDLRSILHELVLNIYSKNYRADK